jgi:hypothetical protein
MMKRLAAALLATTMLTAPELVRAEPITIAIASTVGVELAAGSVAAAVATTALSIGVSVGISLVASSLKSSAPADAAQTSASGTDLSVQYGAALPRSAHMGPGASGGHHVYTNVWGDNNDNLQCVFVVGDGQHGKLTALQYNGVNCTLPSGGLTHGVGYALPEFIGTGAVAGNQFVIVTYYSGRYDQTADPDLVAHSNPVGRWTTDHRGAGVAYLCVQQTYWENLSLTGVPQVLIETEGLVLYDPRHDDTNGGSGPQRWGSIDTYTPSANPAVQEYNFRRGVTINGQRILGMTMSPVNLILQMYFTAMNDNDAPIPLAAGGTEPRYQCSINITDDRANSDVLASIRASTAGWSLERGGQFGPISGLPQTVISAEAFTDDDMIVGEKATFTKWRSRSDIVTAVYGQFSDPTQFWAAAAFPMRSDPADDTTIGERISKSIDLTQVYSSSQAQRIAESERRRTLQQGQGTATLPAKWIGTQPGDWLTYNSARHGSMTVLVTGVALDTKRQVVTITYERISNTVYSWTTAGELFPPDVGDGGASGFIIMFATGMTAVGINIPGDGGLVTPGIQFSWDPIVDPSVDQIDFEIRKVGDTAVLPFTADFPSAGSAVCSGQGIQAATNYEYRHKLYTTPVRDTPWSAWLTVMSGTDHIVPHSLTSIPGDVALASFEAGLKQYVATYLSDALAEVDRIEQLIASMAAEQEANNWLDLQDQKGADVRIVDQVSTLTGGKTWRGDWSPTALYAPNDMVHYVPDDLLYATDVAVTVTEPPAPPWVVQPSIARVASAWTTFAGPDFAAAQTSDMIEARFMTDGAGNDLPHSISVATISNRWQAFAGADYAAAASSDTLEARFFTDGGINDLPGAKSVATINTQWNTFAGPTGASSATHSNIIASINGTSSSIAGSTTAAATIDGRLSASWVITADVNNYISGLKFYSTGSTSNFTVIADQFLIAKPGVGGGSPQPVFAVGTTGGTGKLVLRGDMIADGTITAGAIVAGTIQAYHLAAETVDTAHISGGAITIANSVTLGGLVTGNATGAEKTIMSFTLSIPNTINGSAIPILAQAGAVFQIGNAGGAGITAFLKVNGAVIDQASLPSTSGNVARFSFSGTANVTGNGGTVNASVSLSMTTGGSSDLAAPPGNLGAFAFKR